MEDKNLKAAKLKTAKYCAYQERTQQQLRDKLYDWGLYADDVEEVLSFAIEEGFINEERFAQAYASGHFNLKKWGKVKISHALKQKGLSSYCIEKGLEEIEADQYNETILSLLKKKLASLKETDDFVKKQKAANYLIQKGYESDLVWKALNLLFQ